MVYQRQAAGGEWNAFAEGDVNRDQGANEIRRDPMAVVMNRNLAADGKRSDSVGQIVDQAADGNQNVSAVELVDQRNAASEERNGSTEGDADQDQGADENRSGSMEVI